MAENSTDNATKKKRVSTKNKRYLHKIDFSSVFYSDIRSENMLYGALIRSPEASGAIKAISITVLPQEYSIITANDIPGKNTIETLKTSYPVFAKDSVSYKGEPVGILVGPNPDVIQKLIKDVQVEFKKQDFESEEDDLSLTTSTMPELFSHRTVSYGDYEKTYDESSIQVESSYQSTIQNTEITETNGAYAEYEKKSITIYTPTQWSSHLRKNLSNVLDIEPENVKIKKTISSGTETSDVWHNTVLSCQAAIASYVTKQPVMLILSRHEQNKYIHCVTPITITHKTGLKEDGTITAALVTITVNSGAYSPFSSTLIDRLVISSFGAYKPQTLKIEAVAIKTPNPPTVANTQGVDSHGFFALESHFQKIAEKVKMTPIDLRLRNFFPNILQVKGKFPFLYDTTSIFPVFDEIQKISDYQRRYVSYSHNTATVDSVISSIPVRGIGFATGFEGNGFYGDSLDVLNEKLEVSMETDGSITIHTYKPSLSITEIWKKIVSTIMNIDTSQVNLDSDFDQLDEPVLPETIAGNVSITTQLLKKCCESIQRLRFRQPLPIKAKKSLTKPRIPVWNGETFSGKPYYNTSWGSVVVEVELSPSTFTVSVRNVWITISCGTIMSKQQAISTIQRTVNSILSKVIDETPLTAKKIQVTFIDSNEDPKQIGDLVFNLLPAAFANAVSKAIKKQITSLPMKEDTLYRILSDL